MDCEQTSWISDIEYLQEFNKKISQQRVPISGYLELTRRCNMKCVHCFLGSQHQARQEISKEWTTAQWLHLLDDITAAGCLNVLLTGGEPLLRKDFTDIYRHAKNNGLLTIVFTTGTLIETNASVLELFSELPPRSVEITLYGATAATYESITGVKGSFNRCLAGIRQLLDIGVNLKLKTMLMSLNQHEFFDIKKMAEDFGCRFRFDASIFPTLDGNKQPVEMRVRAAEVVEKELRDNKLVNDWQDYYQRMRNLPGTKNVYRCGAGKSHFHVDPYGKMKPCVMISTLDYDLNNGTFSEGWNQVMPRLRERKVSSTNICKDCEKISLCGYCPAFSYLETGNENIPPSFLCELGSERLKMFMQNGK